MAVVAAAAAATAVTEQTQEHQIPNGAEAEGKKAADRVKTEGYKQADLLVKEAGSNPIKKRVAKIGADKLKKETDKKAQQVEDKANQNADKVVKEADDKALQIKAEYQKKIDKVNVDNIKK